MQQVVGHTPNGREIRTTADGRFEVQPPRDNYWVQGDTPEAALQAAGWIESPDDIEARERRESLDIAIDAFTAAAWGDGWGISIRDVEDGTIDDNVPSLWQDAAMALHRIHKEIN